MKEIMLRYDPYRMETEMTIDNEDVSKSNEYPFKKFISRNIPLQSWIDPLDHEDWKGFVNAVSDENNNDQVHLTFIGRDIDFEDLKRSINIQNKKRPKENKVEYTFSRGKKISDEEISRNIESVVKELLSEKFKKMVDDRNESSLTEKYEALKHNYKKAKDTTFSIVFAGAYSSGKSTLINALIGHDVLPMSNKTCTSRNCRIRHDKTLGKQISLTTFNKAGKESMKCQKFDNDQDAREIFKKICKEDENKEKAETIQMGADLSHLYPENLDQDRFTIELIDTPGMDSAATEKNGENQHKEVAMQAISKDNKPMIILTVPADYSENENIGEFMGNILEQNKKDHGGFKDRFLFVLNKADNINYDEDDNAEEQIKTFGQYLTDSSKWGQTTEESSEDTEKASDFVPRIFMTSGLAALAIKCNYDSSDDDRKLDCWESCYELLEKRICKRKNDNYHLSRHCSIPEYRKDEIEKRFQEAKDKGNDKEAVLLQCGVEAVRIAIQDYIERYAYPIKVRDLLETFEDILKDVKDFEKANYDELKKKKAESGEKKEEKRGEQKEKDDLEEKEKLLKDAQKIINISIQNLESIQFDEDELNKMFVEYKVELASEDVINKMISNPRISTGNKSKEEVYALIENDLNSVQKTFEKAAKNLDTAIQDIMGKHEKNIKAILEIVIQIKKKLESSGVLQNGAYDFTHTVSWKKTFAGIDVMSTEQSMKESFIAGYSEDIYKDNPNIEECKKHWYTKILIPFLKKKVLDYVEEHPGYYDTSMVTNKIDDHYEELRKLKEEMEEYFKKDLKNQKEKAGKFLQDISDNLTQFYQNINEKRNELKKLGKDIKTLDKKIRDIKSNCIWLKELEQKINTAREER